MTKTLLILSITLLGVGLVLVSGLVNVRNVVAVYIALPTGAVLLGLFLVFKLLEKEMASYDEEQRTIILGATQNNATSAATPCCVANSTAKPATHSA